MPETTHSPFRRTELAARRRKVTKACDFCREHRVRCETATPCPQCVSNNVVCNRSRPSIIPRERKMVRIDGGRNRSSIEQPSAHEPLVNATPACESGPVEVSSRTPSPEENLAWTSHRTDSMLGFIARINAFCSGVSQLSLDPTLSGRDPSIEQISPFPPKILQETHIDNFDLSSAQIKHLVRIFWARFRPQMPIVEWKDLEYNGQTHGSPSPLLDAVTAYSLHRVYHSGIHTRLVGLDWPQLQQGSSEIGMPYFQRCLSAVTQLGTFAGPSISVLQCYCYLISYLLDFGQHQAAYNMVGLALQFSQSMNYMDARTGGYPGTCQLFRRIWWTLIHLDFRCSRHVGKPVTIHVEDVMCLRPTREPQDIHISNGLLYHTKSIHLTSAALLVNEAMDRFSIPGWQASRPTDIEARAQILSDNIFHLQEWREEIRKEQAFAHLQFDISNLPLDHQESASHTDQIGQLSIATLLSTLLTLQYHNVIISLHRVFIQFPSHPLTPKFNPKADTHATVALSHAQMMIQIAHQQMAIHEFFYGVSEIYEYLWNAVITIIGFMLAYPYCHRCSRARKPLSLALEIFDSVNRADATARRAATLTRHLRSKFDVLVRNLNIRQPTPDVSLPSGSAIRYQDSQNQSCDSVVPTVQSQDGIIHDMCQESLCSWTDLIDLDAWPAYCDEVSEAFTDPIYFSISHSL
ncbi:hypothetical protein UA08_06372 [Talaromyces atroroseus]|uniref:Zn(2)-C6 fungal-type domain-containing protein n=1 Tax=Talaromyces atroroseus TaxID=1441469 RepID=A0A225AMN7_TALAT|nr:hypothetical protein UA08_06372 [Talaromyces atroroseus]OKL58528.1 hypothetical protein UA08_06372 [Talaromyces atroroseus]